VLAASERGSLDTHRLRRRAKSVRDLWYVRSMRTRILIVDDEPSLAGTLAYALTAEGFDVTSVGLARDALDAIATEPFGLAVLDVGLPDMSGFELCKEIRKRTELPILFLSARSDEIDRIVGLEIGGDDYVPKPFSPREVVARVKTILKRTKTPGSSTVGATSAAPEPNDTGFAIDEARAKIRFCSQPLELTKSEYLILKGMIAKPERVFSRSELMSFVSPLPGASLERTIDAHVKSLRAKLRAIGGRDPIETHRGLGYSLRTHTADA
jgi:two-component system, OmpR family, catabolic regulation response regulator CreB